MHDEADDPDPMTLVHRHASPEQPNRIVLIGGNGFVGGAVRRRAVHDGIDVLSLGRDELDLRDMHAAPDLARKLRSSDAVVFSAARAPCRDIGMMVENMEMVRTVISALVDAPVAHIVNISSDAVYGDETVPITEDVPPAPTTLHGAMHLAREIAFQASFADRLAILRPTLIYGASDPHNGYGPNRFRRLALAGKDIVLFGEGEERRDHVLVDDVADVVLRVVQRGSTGILNVATGEVHSFRDAAKLVVDAARSPSTIKTSPRHGPMPHNGYRPFDAKRTATAFPDFEYVRLPDGLLRVQAEVERGDRHG